MAADLQLIAAVADNNAIGYRGDIPWHLSEDLRHFKAVTLNHAVVMGRRTFESIGRVLPHRRNLLVSSSFAGKLEGLEVAGSLDEAISMVQDGILMVIGGRRLYVEALPKASMLHLTRVHLEPEADTFFPEFSADSFVLVHSESHYSEECQCHYDFETWQRRL